jgi:hypothetical protein
MRVNWQLHLAVCAAVLLQALQPVWLYCWRCCCSLASPKGRVLMRGRAAVDVNASAACCCCWWCSARLLPFAGGERAAPNTTSHSCGVMLPCVLMGATLLAVASRDRSSTSLGARLRGTPQPAAALSLNTLLLWPPGGVRLLPPDIRRVWLRPSSSTLPAMERSPQPSPGVLEARGAAAAAAAAAAEPRSMLAGCGLCCWACSGCGLCCRLRCC